MEREQHLLVGLSKDSKVIEIGPAHNPLVPRSAGWNSFTLDHATREELAAKYATDQNVDTSKIEEVDFVWRGGSLLDAVPAEHHGTFDAFVASHVIEHTTDVVTFLETATTLLKPWGVVLLAVPDKRKCFDFFRHPSTTADAIVAFEERRDRHDVRTHLNYAMYMAFKNGHPGWFESDTTPAALFMDARAMVPRQLTYRNYPGYVDAHNWVFVPASFELMVLELSQLGYLDLQLESLTEMPATEFLVRLRPKAESLSAKVFQERRHALMTRTLIELADQTRQIVGSALYEQPLPVRRLGVRRMLKRFRRFSQ